MARAFDGVSATIRERSASWLGGGLSVASPYAAASRSVISLTAPSPISHEVRRIRPAVLPSRTFHANDMYGELFTLGKLDTHEMEFLVTSHLIMLFSDGISGGCEWSNERRAETLSLVAPNTILFNPAHEYLS